MTGSPVAVIIGPPAAGKTRIGRHLARLLDVPFIDVDHRIRESHGPIPDIFAAHGEEHFRALERAEVVRALGEHAIVSLGGGAVLDTDTQHDLARLTVIGLTVTPEAAAERLDSHTRPLLTGGIDAWVALVESRRALYDKLATATWDTSTRSAPGLAHDIANWLSRRPSTKEQA